MLKPRSQQISSVDTLFYHILSRTVRKAFLCRLDNETVLVLSIGATWIDRWLATQTQNVNSA